MMTITEISDRLEIMDLLIDYCTAVDNNYIDLFDKIFMPNAIIDYSKAGGPKSDRDTIKNYLKKNLGDRPRQHMISNCRILIAGDTATARCICHNPLELLNQEGLAQIVFWGLWYEDKLIRTPDGWRIQERVTVPCYNCKVSSS